MIAYVWEKGLSKKQIAFFADRRVGSDNKLINSWNFFQPVRVNSDIQGAVFTCSYYVITLFSTSIAKR